VILAQFDDDSVVVYQAYRPAIAAFAVEHQHFGGPFSMTRMSWIKPNFLWMMFRSGWATKLDQERVLAVRLRRTAFDRVLAAAVHTTHVAEVYGDTAQWQQALRASDVRLQWDPDHGPSGAKLERRAIQLGLAGDTLRAYATTDIVAVEDITDVVHAQHAHVRAGNLHLLQTPREAPYPVNDEAVRRHLGL
jgi:hypothetical protein